MSILAAREKEGTQGTEERKGVACTTWRRERIEYADKSFESNEPEFRYMELEQHLYAIHPT